jgi:NADH-quinone oxidoreductase subunit G
VNKSWIANSTRLLYQELSRNRLTDGKAAGADATIEAATAAAGETLMKARRVAIVASGHLTVEDNAAALALAQALGAKAEVFGGSWLPVGKPDGIARSGDPVANRAGVKLLGIKDNLDELAARAAEFDCLVTVGNDLWAQDAAKAAKLEAIGTRIALAAWNTATVAKATIAVGIRAWAEVRGTMVNCNGRIQLVQACPATPNPSLEPAWAVLARLAAAVGSPLNWSSEVDAFKHAGRTAPQLAGLSYRAIGPMGKALGAPQPAAVGG